MRRTLITDTALTKRSDSLLGVGAVPAARPVVVPAVASHPRESPGQWYVTCHINIDWILDNYEFRRYLILSYIVASVVMSRVTRTLSTASPWKAV